MRHTWNRTKPLKQPAKEPLAADGIEPPRQIAMLNSVRAWSDNLALRLGQGRSITMMVDSAPQVVITVLVTLCDGSGIPNLAERREAAQATQRVGLPELASVSQN